jgi:hypothetical protein
MVHPKPACCVHSPQIPSTMLWGSDGLPGQIAARHQHQNLLPVSHGGCSLSSHLPPSLHGLKNNQSLGLGALCVHGHMDMYASVSNIYL